MTEPTLKQRLTGTGIEVGTGIGTDLLTAGLLNPVVLAKTGGLSGLAYAGINGFQGAYTNYLVQKNLYGAENVNWGEILSSGALSAIPFMNLKAGKNVANIVGDADTVRRGIVGGAGFGLAGEQLRVGIDEKRWLNPLEAGLSAGIGGGLGGGLTQISKNISQPPLKVHAAAPDTTGATDDLMRQRAGLKMRLRQSIDPEGGGGIQNISGAKITKLQREFPIVRTKEEALDKFWVGWEKGKARTRYYTLADTGEQIMVDIQARPDRMPGGQITKKDFTTVPYHTQDRYELKQISQAHTRYGKIPPEVASYIEQVYGLATLKKYKLYLKDKKNYNKAIKADLIEELNKVKLKLKDEFIKAEGTHYSHFTAVKENLTDSGYVARNFIAKQKSRIGTGKTHTILRNPPKDSGLWTAPNADQIFLEYAKANIGRSNNPAADLDSLQELGIPTNWLESINTFLLQDNAPDVLQDYLIRRQITNYDLKDLVEGRKTAGAIIAERYRSHIEDKYQIGPLDDLIARIMTDPKLSDIDKEIKVERLLDQFASRNLTKGMMDNPETLIGGTKGGPVTVKKPKKPNK